MKKKQVKKMTKKQESGRSMIEMVGVLAVMGLITAAAFVLITSAMRSQKLSRADDDVSSLASGVRLLYANSDDFSGLNGKSADILEILGTSGKTPFGIDNYVIGCGDNGASFSITFSAKSDKEASALAARTWAGGGVAKNTNEKVSIFFGRDELNKPAAANTSCGSGSGGSGTGGEGTGGEGGGN